MDSFNSSSMTSYSAFPYSSGSTVSSVPPQERRQVSCNDGNTAGSSSSIAGRRKKKKQRGGRGSRGGGRGGGVGTSVSGVLGESAAEAAMPGQWPEDDVSSIQRASVAELDTDSGAVPSHQEDDGSLCLNSIEQQQQQQQQLTTSLMNHILDQKKLELLQSPALQRIIQQKQLQQQQLNT